MSGIEAARLSVVATADISKAQAGLKALGGQVDKAGDGIGDMGKKSGVALDGLGGKMAGLGKMAQAALGGVAATAVLAFGKSAITAASDLAESQSKAKQIFGESSKAIEAWSDTSAKAFGQSKQDAIDAASTFATFGKSAGLAGQDLVGFSTKFSGLASDLASFYNTSPADAVQAIGAALRGEAEPIRRYGVLMDDASLRVAAFEAGIISSTKNALTPQQKVLAASALIMKQTGDAQGDFARTSDGLANSQRILSAEWKNAQAELGKKLIPLMLQLTKTATDLMPALIEVADAVADVVAAMGPLLKLLPPVVGHVVGFGKALAGVGDDKLGRLAAGMLTLGGSEVTRGIRNVVGKINEVGYGFDLAAGKERNFTAEAWMMRDANIAGAAALSERAAATDQFGRAVFKASNYLAVATVLQGDMNEELRRTEAAASAAATNIKRIDDAWRSLFGNIDAEQAEIALDKAFKHLPKNREEVLALQEQIAQYGQDILKVPPEAITKINALIDDGKFKLAKLLLDSLTMERTVKIHPSLTPYSGGSSSIFQGSVQGATGGIVTRPTFALIGEAGPEAVVPLNRTPGSSPLPGGMGSGTTIQITIQTGVGDPVAIGRQVHEVLAQYGGTAGLVFGQPS